jgi:hypothetical protein
MMKIKLMSIVLLIGLPIIAPCNDVSSFIWKSTYYGAVPRQKEVDLAYCQQHEPGTFVGIVNDQLVHGAITDRHIQLTQFTFKQHIQDGIYFMQGTLLASGIIDGKKWQWPIKYYVYKLTENGVTRGAWSSEQCKGLYVGRVERK